PQQYAHHRGRGAIAGQSREMMTDEPIEIDPLKVPDHQLESCIGRQSRLGELDPQIAVDPPAKIGFPSSHRSWPFVGVRGTARNSPFKPQREAFFQSRSSMRFDFLLN